MTATTSADRIATLDIVRGVAVMGILVANLPAFGLPEAAYFNPRAWGGTGAADVAIWAANFVLVEGKMRGLFSFLFGASALLVIERAGEAATRVHYRRMATLLVIGLIHGYLIWWGDILSHYALVGSVAFVMRRMAVQNLLILGAVLVGVQALLGAFAALAAFMPEGAAMASALGAPPRAELLREVAAYRGGYATNVAHRWATNDNPLVFLLAGGGETLGYMLWGMAGLKSGFLTGAWERRRYFRIAAWTLPVGWAVYALLAALVIGRGFDWRYLAVSAMGVSTPFRPLLIVGYACLIMLLARPGGWLTERIAAAGRAAFTNYLGTSVFMTAIFYGWGLGLFGRLGRAEMYALVPLAWALMLLWSKPWLERFRYGPLEWLWRSLARLEVQPLKVTPRVRTS